jgi:membrane protein implicated in regulation of membrane protease activity
LLASILVFAFGASATVTVVSGFLAALAALEPWAGVPGAVALITLTVAACLALLTVLMAPRQRRREGSTDPNSGPAHLSRVWTKIKARPLLTAGVGCLAVTLTILNPRYLGPLLRAYLHEGRPAR